MFKKITVGKSKSACRAIAAFTEDLERRDHAGVEEHRATFGRGVTAPDSRRRSARSGSTTTSCRRARSSRRDRRARQGGGGLLKALDRPASTRSRCSPGPTATISIRVSRPPSPGQRLANWRSPATTAPAKRTVHPRLRISAARKAANDGMKDGLAAEAVNSPAPSATAPNVVTRRGSRSRLGSWPGTPTASRAR